MRWPLPLLVLFLASCRSEEPAPPDQTAERVQAAAQTYAGEGRDRLCLNEAKGRAGLITYGQGDANCTLRASVSREGDRLTLVPDGDEICRVAATLAGAELVLGSPPPECAYYCGPTAELSGRSFRSTPQPVPVNDLAGDPLC